MKAMGQLCKKSIEKSLGALDDPVSTSRNVYYKNVPAKCTKSVWITVRELSEALNIQAKDT